MTANPLVAGAVDTATPLSGTGLLDDGAQLVSAIESGDWLAGGLAAFAVGVDTVAAVSDPLGSLIASGLGWLIDHLQPIKGWFDDLTGDAGEVAAFAATWSNIQTQLTASGQELTRKVADLDALAGEAIDAYRRFQEDAAAHLQGAASWAGAMSTGLKVASQVVQLVHDLVRDVLSQLVGSAISWAAEAVFSLGLATPWIIEQVSTRVASWVGKIGGKLTELLTACKKLAGLLGELHTLISKAGALFENALRKAAPAVRRTLADDHGSLDLDALLGGRRAPRGGSSEYTTLIESQVKDVPRAELPPSLAETFTDGVYRTVETTEPVRLYRAFGGNAGLDGAFATTESAGNRLNAKLTSALLPEWKNTRELEAVINVPTGQTLQIGKVAPQRLPSGAWLPGGADQILLPRDWDPGWVSDVHGLPAAFQGRIP